LQTTAAKIHQGNAQLNQVMASLNNLVERPQPDLRPQFDKFSGDLNQLQSLAEDVNDKAADMQAKGQDYFKDWNQQLALIKNEDVRTRSAKRAKDVEAKFIAINGSFQEVKSSFKPFMSDLQDIKTYLGNDLTPAGIDAIKKTVAKANKEVKPLKKDIGKLGDDFKSLGLSMSPTTGAAQ
jgi:phage-related protein